MRSDLDYVRARNLLLASGLKYGVSLLAIVGNQTLTEDMPPILGFDPTNTNRNITLFTPANVQSVYMQKIIHYGTGTGQLVLKDAGAVTIGTLDPGATAECYYINGGWLCFIDQGGVSARNNAAKVIIPLYSALAGLVNAQAMAVAIPYNFTLSAVGFRTRTPSSTAAKLATLTAQVNGVSVTGGVISLTTANTNTSGAANAGTAISASNAGTAGQTVGLVASAVTAFVEGDGYAEFTVVQSTAP